MVNIPRREILRQGFMASMLSFFSLGALQRAEAVPAKKAFTAEFVDPDGTIIQRMDSILPHAVCRSTVVLNGVSYMMIRHKVDLDRMVVVYTVQNRAKLH